MTQLPGLHRPLGSIRQPASDVAGKASGQLPLGSTRHPAFLLIDRFSATHRPLGSIRQPSSAAKHRPSGSIRHPAFSHEPARKLHSEPDDESAAEIPGAARRAARVSAATRVRIHRDIENLSPGEAARLASMAGGRPSRGYGASHRGGKTHRKSDLTSRMEGIWSGKQSPRPCGWPP